MRILVISNYSGNKVTVRPEASIFLGLKRKGVDITVMTSSKSEIAQEFLQSGIRIVDHPLTSKVNVKTIKLIRQTVHDLQIDIVHAFNNKAIMNASLALIGMKTKLVSYRGYSGNIHWYDPSCYVGPLNPGIDHIVCLAESVRESFLRNGVPAKKLTTIHKGHDHAWYSGVEAADLSEFGIPKDALVCSFVANNRVKMKGIEHLVKSTYDLPKSTKIYFLMMGQGLNPPQVQEWLSKSPLKEHFIFTGFREKVTALVKACDISISVSQFGEATQKAMIEAMFLGNPVIITSIPGNRGMVVDGKGGFVIEPGNPDQIKASLLKFYHNRKLIPEMGEAAQKHLSDFLNAEKTINGYEQLYKRLVSA